MAENYTFGIGQPLFKPSGVGVGVRTVLFGHSYMAQEAGGDATLDNFDNFQVLGTVAVANALLGCPLRIVKVVAAGGRRILDMLPRYATEVAPLRPKIVFVNLGHNDLKGLYNNTSDQFSIGPTEVQRELAYLKERFRVWLKEDVSADTLVVLMAETPPGVGPTGTVSTNNHVNLSVRFQKWNRIMEKFVSDLDAKNVMFVPIDRATIDSTSLTMKNKAGHYYDTVHPGIVGTFARANFLTSYLTRILPVFTDRLPTWHGDNYTSSKIATTSAPTFSNGLCTVLFDNTKIGDWRKIEVGEFVTLMIPLSANSILGGRYEVLQASNSGVVLRVPGSLSGAASTTGFISNSAQLFVNPLFVTTTGGQAVSPATGITGNVPAGIDIANLPATHAVTVSTTPHLQRDGSAGFGNWLKLTVTVSGAVGATQFEVRARVAGTSAVNAAYDNDRKINVNQTVQMGLEVRQENVVGGFAGFSADIQGNVTDPPGAGNSVTYKSSVLYRDTGKVPNTADHPWPTEAMTLTLITPEMTFEKNSSKSARIVTNLDGRLYVNFFGDGSVDLYIGRWGTYVIDDPIEQDLINTIAGS